MPILLRIRNFSQMNPDNDQLPYQPIIWVKITGCSMLGDGDQTKLYPVPKLVGTPTPNVQYTLV